MGREVRRVPPNWNHPIVNGQFQPMFDDSYTEASAKWITEFLKWHVAKEYPPYADAEDTAMPYWDWSGPPPDKEYYRPWSDAEATWYQLWENVSEGTPVSPPFERLDDLVEYLAINGDQWDQERGRGGWGIERAKAFCAVGWAPSFISVNGKLVDGTMLSTVKIASQPDQDRAAIKNEGEK